MKEMTKEISEAWESREGAAVFTTVDEKSKPNSIYVTCVSKYDDGTIVIADNYFDKTKKNILAGSKGVILFMTGDKKSYQLKGSIRYHQEGEIFDDMKKWNPKKHPGHAAAAFEIEEAYSGAKKIL